MALAGVIVVKTSSQIINLMSTLIVELENKVHQKNTAGLSRMSSPAVPLTTATIHGAAASSSTNLADKLEDMKRLDKLHRLYRFVVGYNMAPFGKQNKKSHLYIHHHLITKELFFPLSLC